jgi:pimeloyl-ACP methyl ester carboxylesterase
MAIAAMATVVTLSGDKCTVRVHRGKDQAKKEGARPWAIKFVDYAKLSAVVHRPVKDNVSPPDGWNPSPDPVDVVDDPKTSLYFEVWERVATQPIEVVVVFRGTHGLKDWWSNLRWVTRFIPVGWDQYNRVRAEIPGVVDRAKRRHGVVRMATAGHSLGGGLAQQAAYAHPEIKEVYAFDSSPVTGFRSVPQHDRDINSKGIVIDRVYERGEILAYIRTFLRRVVPLSVADPTITEIRFSLSKGDPIKQHSMVDLAKRMEQAAQNC